MNTRTVPKPKKTVSTPARSSVKTSPVKSPPAKSSPAVPRRSPSPVRAEDQDPNLWRMSGRHAVVYVENAVLAGELLATDPKNLARAAMAVYYDRKGKAYAWQVRFDTERWEEIRKRLGN